MKVYRISLSKMCDYVYGKYLFSHNPKIGDMPILGNLLSTVIKYCNPENRRIYGTETKIVML